MPEDGSGDREWLLGRDRMRPARQDRQPAIRKKAGKSSSDSERADRIPITPQQQRWRSDAREPRRAVDLLLGDGDNSAHRLRNEIAPIRDGDLRQIDEILERLDARIVSLITRAWPTQQSLVSSGWEPIRDRPPKLG